MCGWVVGMHHPALILVVVTILSPVLFALQFSSSLGSHSGTELDHILQAAGIELPSPIDSARARDHARELVAMAQKARIAIAAHVIDASPTTAIDSVSIRAKKLQDELMNRIQSHLSAQLDYVGNSEVMEWDLHRGFRDGVAETKGAWFMERVLRPEKFEAVRRGTQDAGYRERIQIGLSRIMGVLRDLNPVAAIRRWRIRRLLNKLSTQPAHPSTPPPSGIAEASTSNPAPQNMDQLRARLSAITALKSTQLRAARADAHDASAASLIESAPVIQSDVLLDRTQDKKLKEQKASPKMTYKRRPGWDGARAQRKWVHALNRGPALDWTNVPIPGMAR